jgi:hypothetical protein
LPCKDRRETRKKSGEKKSGKKKSGKKDQARKTRVERAHAGARANLERRGA